MLYKQTPQTFIAGLGKGTVFRFNLENCIFIEDSALASDVDYSEVLTPYIPTTEEAKAMLEQYSEWCAQFAQPINQSVISYTCDIGVYKSDIAARLKAKLHEYEAMVNSEIYFTSSLGFRCNGDRRSLENMRALYETSDNSISYRDLDNENHSISKDELSTLINELQKNMLSLYDQKWEMMSKLKSIETFEELRESDFSYHFQDFTPNAIELTFD